MFTIVTAKHLKYKQEHCTDFWLDWKKTMEGYNLIVEDLQWSFLTQIVVK